MSKLLSLLVIIVIAASCGAPTETRVAPAPEAAPTGPHPTVAWINACRVPGQGFGWFPGDSAHTSTTGMALDALAKLDALETVTDSDGLVAWLKSRQQPDGGFIEKKDYYGKGKMLPWGSQSSLEATYWAVKALDILGSAPENIEATGQFIAARQHDSGAFDAYEFANGTVETGTYTTFWAVGALKILGLPVPDSAKVVAWLKDQQNTKAMRGGFSLSPDGFLFSSASGTSYAISSLSLLGARPERPDDVRRFLFSSRGQEADGGFELGHGDHWNNYDHYSRTEDTWYGVNALYLLGNPLSDNDTSRAAHPATDCAAWLATVQNSDGGFARFGSTDQTPVQPPSEMQPTWQAVSALTLLGQEVPRPAQVRAPVEQMIIPAMAHRHPAIDFDDPVEIWAFRRLAEPVFREALERTGSRVAAIGAISKWARNAIGPENHASDRHMEGRLKLVHGWGQCGSMSWLVQALASSIDYPARGAYVFADANVEVLIKEDNWDKPHWVCYIPFTNEWIDPGLETRDGARNGWSALDISYNYYINKRDYIYPSLTDLGDWRYWRVYIELVDADSGKWGEDTRIDTTMNYASEGAAVAYPGGSW
jgi:prenyltransferase beta subunit